jgi:hypothetical protein
MHGQQNIKKYQNSFEKFTHAGLVWSGLVWSGLVWSGLVKKFRLQEAPVFLFIKPSLSQSNPCHANKSYLFQIHCTPVQL